MKNIKLSVLALSFVAASASAAETPSFFSKGYGAIKDGAIVAKNGLVTGATAVKDAGVVALATAKAHPYIATAVLAAAAVAIYNRKAIVSGVKNACNKVCKVVANNKKTTLAVAAVLAAVLAACQYGYTTQAYNFLKSFVVKAPAIAAKAPEVAKEVVTN